MTHRIALVTDSTSDIPAAWVKQYEIGVVPLTIIFGDHQYLDGVEISPEQFYARLRQETHPPTTSQPTPKAYLDAYRKAAADGAEEIIVITISAAMSGSMQSARQAAQQMRLPVHLVDGQNTSMGLGWQVMAAARAREAGAGREAMLAAAEHVRKHVAFYISLDTIEYLSRGGRIMEAARFLDSILRIKPLIYVHPDTGRVGASIPARSRKTALEGLYKEFFHQIPPGRPIHMAVLHNNALEEAQELAARVQREVAPCEMFIAVASPVLGVHSGPQAIALCGYAEK